MTASVLDRPIERVIELKFQEIYVHHWIIDLPTGPFSNGVCKKCGGQKEFSNRLPEST